MPTALFGDVVVVRCKELMMGYVFRSLVVIAVCVAPVFANAAEQLKLADLSEYLNSLTTVKSSFTQINDDGSISTGQLYISRPGKMRFEYDPPERSLVIAAASAVHIIDAKSNQPPEVYPLNKTPLSLILKRNIDLTRARLVEKAVFDGKSTTVTARDQDNPENGFIELTFTDNPTQLRQWIIYDASGAQTTIILGAFEAGVSLPSTLFNVQRATSSDR